jgi:hypothetical protein
MSDIDILSHINGNFQPLKKIYIHACIHDLKNLQFLEKKIYWAIFGNQLMCEGFGLWPQAGLSKMVRRQWHPLLIFMLA